MRKLVCAMAILLGAGYAMQAIAETETDRPIMKYGEVVVTQEDLRQYVNMSVPLEKQAQFWSDRKKVEEYVFGMFVTRELAEQARMRPLNPKERRILTDLENRALSQFQIDYIYDNAKKPDFEVLARETYKAKPEEFIRPEEVRIEHVLISTKNRLDGEAKQLAEKVLALAKTGDKPFADLVAEYSDDPSSKRNKGDLGFFARGRMVKPFEEAAFAMKEPGEIGGPVKTNFGYHVLRLDERKAKEQIPFEEVREKLIKAETDRFRKELVDDEVAKLKKLDGVNFDQNAFEELISKPVVEAK
jgi:peptidyl-prolyl cis-trans isomerase C